MLSCLLPYVRGVGVDARWLVIDGNAEFFAITKRLHHALHGGTGDGTPLGPDQRAVYERTLRANTPELLSMVRPRDVVLLHDPQTAGLAPELLRAGAVVIWRCHIGADEANDEVDSGWDFSSLTFNVCPPSSSPVSSTSRSAATTDGRHYPTGDRRLLGEEPGPR